MTRTRERSLICFVIITIFVVVQLHFIMSHPRQPQHPLPCPSEPGIHWVRDPQNCSHYFICVASQPIRMPPCPEQTVWSVAGRNCVPVHSIWDDCLRIPPHPTSYSGQTHRSWSASSDMMDALADNLHPEASRREKLLNMLPNHPCAFSELEGYLPHPSRCHWFYNCSIALSNVQLAESDLEGWDDLTEECPYPNLFSLATHSCRHYAQVDCATRGLFLDPCEYRHMHCQEAHCQPCNLRYGSCVGLSDGLQSFPGRQWTPRYLVCKDQRALQQLDCPQNKPIFSPETRRCESLFDIPKIHGGYQPSCQGRHDGRYPDETGRCDMFYDCADNVIQGRFQCPSGTVFHPEKQACRRENARGVLPLCGKNESTAGRTSLSVSFFLCNNMEDGMYADPYGRCPLYYECQRSLLKKYHKCNFGSFDPRSQDCQFSESQLSAPCGQQPNLCLNRTDGQYADLASNCQTFFYCKRNMMIRESVCPSGSVFNEDKRSCQLPNDTPPPCGLAPSCNGRPDGKYPSPLKGCQFYFICSAGVFRGYGRCSVEQGGFYFNMQSGSCDFPQNVCVPCGIRTDNCTISLAH